MLDKMVIGAVLVLATMVKVIGGQSATPVQPVEMNMLCQESFEVGSSLSFISFAYVMEPEFGNVDITVSWVKLEFVGSEDLTIASCTNGMCSLYLDDFQTLATVEPIHAGGSIDNESLSDGSGMLINGWTSTLSINSTTNDLAGRWMCTWMFADFSLEHVCDVRAIEAVFHEMECPPSFFGYPVSVTSNAKVTREEFMGLEWFAEVPIYGLIPVAFCSPDDFSCSPLAGLNFSLDVTIRVNELGYLQSDVIHVGQTDLAYGIWRSNWMLRNRPGLVNSCTPQLSTVPTAQDCLEPMVDQSNLKTGVLHIVFSCFTWRIIGIQTTGNYALTFEQRQVAPSLFENKLNVTFDLLGSIENSMFIQSHFDFIISARTENVLSTTRLDVAFVSQLDFTILPEYAYESLPHPWLTYDGSTMVGDEVLLIPGVSLFKEVIQVARSFPFSFESYFEMQRPVLDDTRIVVKKELRSTLRDMFDFQIQYTVPDQMGSEQLFNRMLVILPETVRYPKCVPEMSFDLYTNMTEPVIFDLPCTIFDTDDLDLEAELQDLVVNVILDLKKSKILAEVTPDSLQTFTAQFAGVSALKDSMVIRVVSNDGIVRAAIRITFNIRRSHASILATPEFLQMSSTRYFTKISFMFNSTMEDLQLLIDKGIITDFHLQIQHNSLSLFYFKYSVLNSTTNTAYNLIFKVPPLRQLEEYTVSTATFYASGSIVGSKAITLVIPAEPPWITSALTSLVTVNQNVTLNCTSKIHGDSFRWYHWGDMMTGENGYQLNRVASQSTNGSYKCEMYTNKQYISSDNFGLTVSGGVVLRSTGIEIAIKKDWRPELDDFSSMIYRSFRVYIEALLKEGFKKDPYIIRYSVEDHFRQGSIIATVEIFEKNLEDQPTQSGNYLRQELDAGLDEYFNLNGDSDLYIGEIHLDLPEEQIFMVFETEPMAIECLFSITHYSKPQFKVLWLFNGSAIDQTKATTFTFSNWTVLGDSDWLNVAPMKIYHFGYRLAVQTFPLRLIGKYQCQVELISPFLPSLTDHRRTSSELDITYSSVVRQPTVTISPLLVVVQDSNERVSVTCSYNGLGVILLNSKDEEISRAGPSSPAQIALETFGVSPLQQGVRCQVMTQYDFIWKIQSEMCHIRLVETETVLCSDSMDDQGLMWTAIDAGVMGVEPCPSGYSGVIKRECKDNGEWGNSNYLNCKREVLKSIKEEVKGLNDDGIKPTKEKISVISDLVNNSVASPGPILAGDIVQVAAILQQVGMAVSDDNERSVELVDDASLENFANAADAILSTDDSEWGAITEAEEAGNVDEETTGVGQKLVVGIDKLVASTLASDSYSSKTIVKKNVAIKRDSVGQDDIEFPDKNDEEYVKYDNWVVDSGNEAFLSSQNFKDLQEPVKYAVVLFNGMSTKFVVQHKEQTKYSSTSNLKRKEVASDVTSFSLSTTSISTFISPLKLEFSIKKENSTRPVCAYLDTSLGKQPVWSTRGCITEIVNSDVVKCQCDHLTNFAVLMSPSGTSEEHHEILTIVTYVGCGISIICLLVTIILHVITWKYVKDDRSILNVHLCVMLVLAYATFLAGINQTDNDTICMAVAALLHFFFLSVFCIMLAEGLQMLLTVTFVFSKKSHLWKLLLISYVIPLLIVGGSLGITQTVGYRSSDFCWLSVESGFLWAFVGPALLVILINLIIMITTLKTMMSSYAIKSKDAANKLKSAIRAIFILCPIFGLTWVFGVFSVNSSLVIFQYLFAIFNTLQGLFIFLVYGILSHHIKDGLKHRRRRRTARRFGSQERPFNSSDKQFTSSQTRSGQDSSGNKMSAFTTSTKLATSTTSLGPSRQSTKEIPASNAQAWFNLPRYGVSKAGNMAMINPTFSSEENLRRQSYR